MCPKLNRAKSSLQGLLSESGQERLLRRSLLSVGDARHEHSQTSLFTAVQMISPGSRKSVRVDQPSGHRVRPRRPGLQTGLALGPVPDNPGPDALAGDAYARSDVGLLPSGLVPLHDQPAAMDSQTALRWNTRTPELHWALDKPHSTRRVLLGSTRLAATNVLAGYTRR